MSLTSPTDRPVTGQPTQTSSAVNRFAAMLRRNHAERRAARSVDMLDARLLRDIGVVRWQLDPDIPHDRDRH